MLLNTWIAVTAFVFVAIIIAFTTVLFLFWVLDMYVVSGSLTIVKWATYRDIWSIFPAIRRRADTFLAQYPHLQASDAYVASLSEKQKRLLQLWTRCPSLFRKACSYGPTTDESDLLASSHYELVVQMDEIFRNAPKLEKSIIVQRVVHNTTPVEFQYTLPHWMSTTITFEETDIVRNRTNTDLYMRRILVPEGTPILFLPHVSHYPQECEILLPRNTHGVRNPQRFTLLPWKDPNTARQQMHSNFHRFLLDISHMMNFMNLDVIVAYIRLKTTSTPHICFNSDGVLCKIRTVQRIIENDRNTYQTVDFDYCRTFECSCAFNTTTNLIYT